ADGRVDFRDLIRHFAKEFKVKIEMRQIGARQESARIGGMGPCGRELCCSTWLTSYRTVSTAAARYQNLAINQAKLSGQCGRLKCCLNYELDTYMEALSAFPENADRLKTKMGVAILVKTDIFKGVMYYAYNRESGRDRMYILDLKRVRDIRDMNKKGEFPDDLPEFQATSDNGGAEERDFEDVTGVIELPPEERKGRGKRRSKPGKNRGTRTENQKDAGSPHAQSKPPERKEQGLPGRNRGNRNRGRGHGGNKNRNNGNNKDK
ncbi:MAG: hypothetical protein EPO28_02680, partial [Saprospiraceae bacterium]